MFCVVSKWIYCCQEKQNKVWRNKTNTQCRKLTEWELSKQMFPLINKKHTFRSRCYLWLQTTETKRNCSNWKPTSSHKKSTIELFSQLHTWEPNSHQTAEKRRLHLPVWSWHVTIKTWATETTRKRKVLKCTELIVSRRKTWAVPACAKKKAKKKEPRLSLHHHEYESASPCKQQADPAQTAWVAFFFLCSYSFKWEECWRA